MNEPMLPAPQAREIKTRRAMIVKNGRYSTCNKGEK